MNGEPRMMVKIALARILPATLPRMAALLDTDLHGVHARMHWYRKQGLVRKADRAVIENGRALAVWECTFADPLAGLHDPDGNEART